MVILAPALNYTGAACQTDNPVRGMSPASVSGMHGADRACEVDLPTTIPTMLMDYLTIL